MAEQIGKEEVARRLGELEKLVDGELIPLREKVKRLEEEVKKVEEEKTGWEEQVVRLQEQRDEVRKENEMLQTQMKGFAGFRDALYSLVGDIIDTALAGKESKIVAQVSESLQRKEGLTVEATRTGIEVQVSRPTVVAEETSLRGQIAILISEGYLDKYRSARSVGRDLISLGYKIAETSSTIIDELDWFTQQRILKHDDKQGWMAADKSRIKVKTVD